MRATLVALIAFGAAAVRGFGSIPQPASFSICNPDPEVLVWDTTPVPGELRKYVGWLKVPILHEQPSLERLEVPLGFTALRVSVFTKCAAGAKPLLTVRAYQCPGHPIISTRRATTRHARCRLTRLPCDCAALRRPGNRERVPHDHVVRCDSELGGGRRI